MKTTLEMPDSLLDEAKRVAANEETTLRALMEEGLRRVLAERKQRRKFHLRRATFKGKGLQPGIAEGDWERIRDLAYEGRGA
ncbi:MAG TPA: type II toxin-antitoxin system VapB family antitoxin [Thermoanaerobaculia bacterium]|nr:type II toxin-antitoxin system VapB family antitoxin [Thermoanaerobaculia bacterium]